MDVLLLIFCVVGSRQDVETKDLSLRDIQVLEFLCSYPTNCVNYLSSPTRLTWQCFLPGGIMHIHRTLSVLCITTINPLCQNSEQVTCGPRFMVRPSLISWLWWPGENASDFQQKEVVIKQGPSLLCETHV
jgi:hypothetical protein